MGRLIKAFTIISLLLILVSGLFGLYVVVKAVHHVEKHGLKSAMGEVWYGSDHKDSGNDR